VYPEHKQNALLRLKTVRGHIDGVIGMVEKEVYCPDLMKQVAALQASLERVNRILLQNHLETCVTEAIQTGKGQEKIRELIEALRFNGGLTDFRGAEMRVPRDDETNVTPPSPAAGPRKVAKVMPRHPGARPPAGSAPR
jgi:DNA-binding FrmR family transcriptional regulator